MMDEKMKAALNEWFQKEKTVHIYEIADFVLDYLRSQQGLLDRKRFERSPCYLCGYNGEGYYQPDKHPCAARYHAKQPAAAGEEIMVNTPYDVFTLPLQPSGLDGNGPRFVVHVPGAEQHTRQHPDDAAVDRFAVAMKAKLNKKRQEGRGGWQSMTAEQLSALLHEHVRKGDPVDVANLAMMLHQNGQRIELPEQPAADQFVATFRYENNEIVGTTDAKVHSVTRHDDGRIEVIIDHWPEQPAAHPATTHCDNCGCDWLDNGLNPVGCPYCKQNAWRAAFVAERAVRYCEGGMAIEQARIHAETGATLMEHAARQQPAAADEGGQ